MIYIFFLHEIWISIQIYLHGYVHKDKVSYKCIANNIPCTNFIMFESRNHSFNMIYGINFPDT